ncbi:lipocalin [Sagittula sp. SSi028]|uniref:lipocalin n=1 Tax=Sagittula sp. SSi028 TaxID=3400636 RepID=UPI003AF43572
MWITSGISLWAAKSAKIRRESAGVLVFALAVLSACTPEPVAVVDVVPVRNPTALVASQADASLGRISGRWIVVESSRFVAGAPIVIGQGAVQFPKGAAVSLTDMGRGRFVAGPDEVWVHWLDADARTAAIGDPHGGWFAVIDRTGAPRERLHAARDILEWYGYDLARRL